MRKDAKSRDLLGALPFLRAVEGQAEVVLSDSSSPKALPTSSTDEEAIFLLPQECYGNENVRAFSLTEDFSSRI